MTSARAATILNVNDRLTARYYVTITLQRAGFTVLEAETGEAALRLAANAKPDLVVLDIKLPDIDGYEVCRRLRGTQETSGITVLHTSAQYVTTEHKLEALGSGADGYLAQPFEPQELVATVKALLRASNAEKDAHDAQRRAEEALRLRDEFLGMATHELRNPATTVHLQLATLMRLLEGPNVDLEVVTQRVAAAHRGSKHLIDLLKQLMDVSRLEEGKAVGRPREIDLREVVNEVMQRYSDDASRARCTFNVHAPVPLHGLWDATQVDQVLSNLVSNALKYAPGGPVDVSAVAWLKNSVLLTVRDHGPGISPEDQKQLFERYSRVTQAPVPGFGLGLWITKKIITEAGGTISLESDTNTGATFKVVLPRGEANRLALVPQERAG